MEGRENEISNNSYPKNHLWGVDAVEKHHLWNVKFLNTKSTRIPNFLESYLNQFFFRGSPGVKIELTALRASRRSDLIYSVCGPLSLACLYPNKLVSWTFRNPISKAIIPKLAHLAYRESNLSSNAGFLCLTPSTESNFERFAPSKFIPWCVDTEMFQPSINKSSSKPYFFASGKTERDYNTFVEAARNVQAKFRIIGPNSLKPPSIPSNVTWIETSTNPPDSAVNYKTLVKWYNEAIAVCIPLNGDANDTCGYTNMLEAMAMSKPVLMTDSGCLHVNPQKEKFGYLLRRKDPVDWSEKMNLILSNQEYSKSLGENGRKVALRDFNIQTFNKNLISFIKVLLR